MCGAGSVSVPEPSAAPPRSARGRRKLTGTLLARPHEPSLVAISRRPLVPIGIEQCRELTSLRRRHKRVRRHCKQGPCQLLSTRPVTSALDHARPYRRQARKNGGIGAHHPEPGRPSWGLESGEALSETHGQAEKARGGSRQRADGPHVRRRRDRCEQRSPVGAPRGCFPLRSPPSCFETRGRSPGHPPRQPGTAVDRLPQPQPRERRRK